jgi:hypothetical protein
MAGLIAWIDTDQEPLLRAVVEQAELELVAVGSPTGDSGRLAQSLNTERLADLRDPARLAGAELVWVASASDVGEPALRVLHACGRPWISSEPRSGPLFVPLLRRSPGFIAASEILLELGEIAMINVSCTSGPGEGSLVARLFDAFDIVNALCGQPETLDAAYAPAATRGAPESLTDMDGHVTVNLRFTERRCAAVSATNHGGTWSRRVTLVGSKGTLRFDDHAVEWPEADPGDVDATPADLIARQVRRMLARLDGSEPAPATDRLLAWCQAARLSIRTGANEAPESVMEMLNRV